MAKCHRLQVLANIYSNALVAHAVSRVTTAVTREASKKNQLHIAQMDMFSLAFKILTCYRKLDETVLAGMDALFNQYVKRLMTAYREGYQGSTWVSTRAKQLRPGQQITVHLPVIMAHAYYVHADTPCFTAPIPSIELIMGGSSTTSVYFAKHNVLNQRIRMGVADYRACVEAAQNAVTTMLAWVQKDGVPIEQIEYLAKKPREMDKNWAVGTLCTSGRAKWNRILQSSLPNMQTFINKVVQLLELPADCMNGIEVSTWVNASKTPLRRIENKRGAEMLDQLVSEATNLDPGVTFSIEHGDIQVVGTALLTQDVESGAMLHPAVSIETTKGKVIATVALAPISQIVSDVEFKAAFPAEWQKAQGFRQVYAAATVADIGGCIKTAHDQGVSVSVQQRQAQKAYADWTEKKAMTAKAAAQLKGLRDIVDSLANAELVLDPKDVAALRKIAKKIKK